VHCMNINPKPFATDSNPVEDAEGYVPPLVRTSMAIRNWQAKLKARRIRSDRFHPRMTYSGSSFQK